MNPFLAAAIVMLMLLSFARAVTLIDWRMLPSTPAASACPTGVGAPKAADPAPSPNKAAVSHTPSAAG